MFNTGIRLVAARCVRRFVVRFSTASYYAASRNSQELRSFLKDPLWERPLNRSWQLSSPLRALSVSSLAAWSTVHSQADNSEEDAGMRKQDLLPAENETSDDKTTKACSEHNESVPDILGDKLRERMDSQSTALLCATIGSNIAIYSAFSLALFLNRQPRRNPTLLRFLSRNFLLSPGWLSRGRWHVILTSTLTYLSFPHFIRGVLLVFGFVCVSLPTLDVWQIASLYFGAGCLGGVVSVALMKKLRKPRYLAHTVGGSCGEYALMYYHIFTHEMKVGVFPSVPFDLIVKTMLVYMFLKESVGLRKYILYGFKHGGRGGVSTDYAGHLTGAVVGLLAAGYHHVLEYIQTDVGVHEDNERKGQEEGTEGAQQAMVAKQHVRE